MLSYVMVLVVLSGGNLTSQQIGLLSRESCLAKAAWYNVREETIRTNWGSTYTVRYRATCVKVRE